MQYTVVLVKDSSSSWFTAEVPALPGCVSQGRTKAEALENVKDAISGYLASLKKHPEEKFMKSKVEIEAVIL
ncbi:MAG TPA: type II toxin-antitoxin system HicB family antitoxin [archaeon]|nr:type II toxin-antitoxin system HicB family antitoxin [archaeon]